MQSRAANPNQVGRARGCGLGHLDVAHLRGPENQLLDLVHRASWVLRKQLGRDARDMRRRHAGAAHGVGVVVA
eukprot:scaffold48398_cov67-Phaeocystis_antarctica.AAC.6